MLELTFSSGDKKDLFSWIVGSAEVLSEVYPCRTTGGEITDTSDLIVRRSR